MNKYCLFVLLLTVPAIVFSADDRKFFKQFIDSKTPFVLMHHDGTQVETFGLTVGQAARRYLEFCHDLECTAKQPGSTSSKAVGDMRPVRKMYDVLMSQPEVAAVWRKAEKAKWKRIEENRGRKKLLNRLLNGDWMPTVPRYAQPRSAGCRSTRRSRVPSNQKTVGRQTVGQLPKIGKK